jgi:hypothetical protein
MSFVRIFDRNDELVNQYDGYIVEILTNSFESIDVDEPMIYQDLEEYAKEQINAAAYPADDHRCYVYPCSNCNKVVLFKVRISYSVACDEARPAYDFAGTVYGTCIQCNQEQKLFSIQRGNYPEEEQEYHVCSCGSDAFILCMCERYEGLSGLAGFFDEGVLVGKCETCGTPKTFLYTD